MVVLLEGSPNRGTLELGQCPSVRLLVTSLTKALLPRLFSLAGRPAQGRVLVVSNLLYLRDPQCWRHFLIHFPRSVPQHNPVTELYGHFLQPNGLVFALTCTVNCGTLYRQVFAFPNHVQSMEFTTCGLKSSCRNISIIINGNRMHLSSFLRFIAKGLNTYV